VLYVHSIVHCITATHLGANWSFAQLFSLVMTEMLLCCRKIESWLEGRYLCRDKVIQWLQGVVDKVLKTVRWRANMTVRILYSHITLLQ
jgi:hypothetical protein